MPRRDTDRQNLTPFQRLLQQAAPETQEADQPTSARRVDTFDARRVTDHIETDIRSAFPFSATELVEVTFNATANADTVIRHSLNPTDPDGVKWSVWNLSLMASPSTVPVIYQDSSTAHRAWQTDYIILRSNVASLKAVILLGVPRE